MSDMNCSRLYRSVSVKYENKPHDMPSESNTRSAACQERIAVFIMESITFYSYLRKYKFDNSRIGKRDQEEGDRYAEFVARLNHAFLY